MQTVFQSIIDALTSPVGLQIAASCGAVLGACRCCGHNHSRQDDDDKLDADFEDEDQDEEEPDFNFNFSREDMREYEEFVKQTDERIVELVDQLDSNESTSTQEIETELIGLYLSRASRLQEEGVTERATDDYAAAFDRIACYTHAYGESVDVLKQESAARLNYAIMLNDEGELDEAEEEYCKAAETMEKLVGYGDEEAKVDRVGVLLNRASIYFERGRKAESFNMLDEAAEEFQKLAETSNALETDVSFYLAKTWTTKADFLRATVDDEENADQPILAEAREAYQRAINVYRALIRAGHSEYKRDFADALVSFAAIALQRDKEEVEATLNALVEACDAYESVVAYGEHDACVELFDATMQRGELLLKAEREEEAAALYDGVLETFDQFEESDELPLMEGMAIAHQRRATIRKNKITTKKLIDDLTKAIVLQTRIADSLIESLRGEEHNADGCDRCDCDENGCSCETGCGCGGGCGCGRHSGECDDTERKFLIEKWGRDNYRALTECLYARACAYLETQNAANARADCVAAEQLGKAYRAVLRDGESIDSEFEGKIRDLKLAL